jgi:hypothetical protein
MWMSFETECLVEGVDLQADASPMAPNACSSNSSLPAPPFASRPVRGPEIEILGDGRLDAVCGAICPN